MDKNGMDVLTNTIRNTHELHKNCIYGFLLIVGLGLAVNGYSQSFLTNGLIAYYPFNGNANDAVGANNMVSYGCTLTADRFGNPASAYSFDGVTNYMSATDYINDITNTFT